MREKSAHKTPTHETENHIEVDNEHGSDESDANTAKQSGKEMVEAGSDEESNRSEAGVFQSTRQTNTDASGSTLSAVQRGKCLATNTLVRATGKERPSSATEIRNPSKSPPPKRTKVTGGHKIATSIDNMVKELANTRKLRIEPTERAVKLLVSTYSHNKHRLLGGLKLLGDERNVPIFLSLTGKIQRDWLHEECGVAYEGLLPAQQ